MLNFKKLIIFFNKMILSGALLYKNLHNITITIGYKLIHNITINYLFLIIVLNTVIYSYKTIGNK